MKDPRRLMEEGAGDFERKLLSAGRSDTMSTVSRKRVLAGLGVSALLPASVLATGAAEGTAKGGSMLAASSLFATAKWVGGSALGALALWGGLEALPVVTEPAATPQVATANLNERTREVAHAVRTEHTEPPAEAVVEEVAPAVQEAETVAPRAQAADEPRASELSEELAAIERARGAVLGGDYALGNRLLDDYARRFPKRRLQVEATVLRIQALEGAGDRAGASQLAKEFLAKHPNGPYARRVRSLVGEATDR